jgi:hypothetical protein
MGKFAIVSHCKMKYLKGTGFISEKKEHTNNKIKKTVEFK